MYAMSLIVVFAFMVTASMEAILLERLFRYEHKPDTELETDDLRAIAALILMSLVGLLYSTTLGLIHMIIMFVVGIAFGAYSFMVFDGDLA